MDLLGSSTCPGGIGCKPTSNADKPESHLKADPGEPNPPAPNKKVKTVRVRHYTNRTGSKGIEKEGVITAKDNNRVYLEPANTKVLSSVDAQQKYQIGKGKGRDYIELDVPESRLEWVKNPDTTLWS